MDSKEFCGVVHGWIVRLQKRELMIDRKIFVVRWVDDVMIVIKHFCVFDCTKMLA